MKVHTNCFSNSVHNTKHVANTETKNETTTITEKLK
jgi:hypothetical protein